MVDLFINSDTYTTAKSITAVQKAASKHRTWLWYKSKIMEAPLFRFYAAAYALCYMN